MKIVSGAASGGAYFVVDKSINSAADLKGKTVASPQLGNTQDVSLRNWLKSKGLNTDTTGGGDVKIVPQDNATSLASFQAGNIEGAWVPEPWATRLVNEGGGKILVDEADLWPEGKYVTTQLIVTTDFLKDHPDVVQKLVNGQVAANDYIKTNTADAETDVSDGIKAITGKPIDGNLVIASFKNIEFTNDPIASSLVNDNATQKKFGLPGGVEPQGPLRPLVPQQGTEGGEGAHRVHTEAVTTHAPQQVVESSTNPPVEDSTRPGGHPRPRVQGLRHPGRLPARARQHHARRRAGRVRVPARRVRVRQEHVAQHRCRPRCGRVRAPSTPATHAPR